MLIGHPSTVKLATIGSLTVFWVTFLDDDELVVLDDDDVNFVLFFITASLMTVTAELLELLLRFLGTVINFFFKSFCQKKNSKLYFKTSLIFCAKIQKIKFLTNLTQT